MGWQGQGTNFYWRSGREEVSYLRCDRGTIPRQGNYEFLSEREEAGCLGALMINTNNERTEFIEALAWMGAPPYPLLFYAVCERATVEVAEEVKSFWPEDADIDFFCLADDWPFEIALVEISLSELSDDLDNRIKNTLEAVASTRSTATCFMFEGGFGDYQQLFDSNQQRSTYGLCLGNSRALVCTKDCERESHELADRLAGAKAWLLERYLHKSG